MLYSLCHYPNDEIVTPKHAHRGAVLLRVLILDLQSDHLIIPHLPFSSQVVWTCNAVPFFLNLRSVRLQGELQTRAAMPSM